jgi:hypothetical protein
MTHSASSIASRIPTGPLPTTTLLVGNLLVGLLIGALWAGITMLLGLEREITLAGLTEIGLVTVVGIAAIFAMTPWKMRPATGWLTTIFTVELVRLAATIGLTVLLYSATRMAPKALLVSAFSAFVGILIIETTITARSLGQLSPPDPTTHG